MFRILLIPTAFLSLFIEPQHDSVSGPYMKTHTGSCNNMYISYYSKSDNLCNNERISTGRFPIPVFLNIICNIYR